GPHQQIGGDVFAIKRRAMGLLEIAVTRHTLQLPPGVAARMTIGADVTATGPAVIGTLVVGTELLARVDTAFAAARGGDRRWRDARRLGTAIQRLLTGVTQRFMEEAGKGCRGCGASAW